MSELRQLLGKAVRAQAEQQHEIESLRDSLREERTVAGNAREMASNASRDAEELRQQVESLRSQLADEQVRSLSRPRPDPQCASPSHHVAHHVRVQRERMESESAALEREEELEVRLTRGPLARMLPCATAAQSLRELHSCAFTLSQAKIEEMREAERHRIALESAMEEAMSKDAPKEVASIKVSTPPPSAPPPGFDMSAGGFSL